MKKLEELLTDKPDSFPVGTGINVLAGKMLTQTGTWKKAILLVKIDKKHQLRLYGWQKNKEGLWKLRQKFNMSKKYVGIISDALLAFESVEEIEEESSKKVDEESSEN